MLALQSQKHAQQTMSRILGMVSSWLHRSSRSDLLNGDSTVSSCSAVLLQSRYSAATPFAGLVQGFEDTQQMCDTHAKQVSCSYGQGLQPAAAACWSRLTTTAIMPKATSSAVAADPRYFTLADKISGTADSTSSHRDTICQSILFDQQRTRRCCERCVKWYSTEMKALVVYQRCKGKPDSTRLPRDYRVMP